MAGRTNFTFEEADTITVPVPAAPTRRSRKDVVEFDQVSQNHYFGSDPGHPARHYYLELVRGGVDQVIDSIEIPNVNHWEGDFPLAVVRTWTMGGMYEEHAGFAERTFSLRGRSGKTRLSLVLFQKFRNFLEKYANLMAENKNALVRGEDINLILNFPWEGESFYCTVMQYKALSDTASSRCSYEYTITLKTHGFATRKWALPQNILRLLDSPGDDTDHTGINHPCFKRSVKCLEDGTIDIPGAPEDAFYIYGKAPRIYPQVAQIGQGMGGMRSGARSTYQSIYDLGSGGLSHATLLWDNADESVRELERITRRMTTVVGWYVWLCIQAKEAMGLRSQHLTDQSDPGFPATDYVTPIPPREGREPLVVDTILASDTSAFDISMRLFGTRDLWQRIVRANNMLDSRTKWDGTSLLAGDRILVPSVVGVAKNQVYDIYGTDVAIGPDGDFVLSGTTDISVVTGINNVDQNLTHRYKTVKGENRAFPEFGLPRIIGNIATSDLNGQVMSAVKQQTVRDHRVRGVSQMSVSREGGTVTVDIGVDVVANAVMPKGFQYPGL